MRIPPSFDMAGLLVELGLRDVEQREDEVFAICPEPSHDDRRAGSWSLNVTNGEHYCFACGFGGSLARLVALQRRMVYKAKGADGEAVYNILAAQEWLNDRIDSLEGAGARLRAMLDDEPDRVEVVPMGEERLLLYDPPPRRELERRYISEESAAKYGVLWDSRKKAWILPIRNPRSGELLGWQIKGRNEFRNHPPGVRKSDTLFGYHCFTGNRAVMVESPLDAPRMDSAGVEGVVASYGAAFSKTQMDLICDVADELVVAVDNPRIDPAGYKAAAEILKTYSRRLDVRFFNYSQTDAKDPGDMERDEDVRWAVEHARHSVRGKAAIGA